LEKVIYVDGVPGGGGGLACIYDTVCTENERVGNPNVYVRPMSSPQVATSETLADSLVRGGDLKLGGVKGGFQGAGEGQLAEQHGNEQHHARDPTSPSTVFDSQNTSAENSLCDDSNNVDAAQQVVKNFVRTIVKGMTLCVLSVNGGTAECVVTMDRKLTTMSLQRAGKKDGKKRSVPLERIAEIAVGDDVRDQVDLQVNDHCVTLLLDDGQGIGFQFRDLEERDTFALCLSMFVDGRRAEVDKKKKR
jgi:hypothetical protein